MNLSFECRNVNEAYWRLTHYVHSQGIIADSRVGKVKTIPHPVTLHVRFPRQRVLFDPTRNCNPFFHLMEALWMLAGRNDVDFVRQFNSQMYTYSDNGKTFNGAYGYRWRHYFGYDQIAEVIKMLRENHLDRRVLIGMWDPREDLGSESLDIPCNQQMMFRDVWGELAMLTTNRSNDLIWGLCGANAVHLTILQEYIAAALGLKTGAWTHVTNNLHVYERHWDLMPKDSPRNDYLFYPHTIPLVKDWDQFNVELETLLQEEPGYLSYKEPFFEQVADVMYDSWKVYKSGDLDEALSIATEIGAADWRRACVEWLTRVKLKREAV